MLVPSTPPMVTVKSQSNVGKKERRWYMKEVKGQGVIMEMGRRAEMEREILKRGSGGT